MPPQPIKPTVVQKAGFRPYKCNVTGNIEGPFLDCGVKWEQQGYWHRLYLDLQWLEEMGRKHLDMVPRARVDELARRVREAEAELHQIKLKSEKLDEAEKMLAEVRA